MGALSWSKSGRCQNSPVTRVTVTGLTEVLLCLGGYSHNEGMVHGTSAPWSLPVRTPNSTMQITDTSFGATVSGPSRHVHG